MLTIVDNEIRKELNNLPEDFFDFKQYTQDALTHGLHDYPAMFIYPLPRYFISLIKKYQPEIAIFLDPFCGAGTALVEAIVAGFSQIYGNDLNPLSLIIGKAKTTSIPKDILVKECETLVAKINNDYETYNETFYLIDNEIKKQYNITHRKGWGDSAYSILNNHLKKHNINDFIIPDFSNMGYWFLPRTILELQLIKNNIREIKDKNVYTYFLTVFSETVRYVSNRRNNEFKMYRMEVSKLKEFNPDVKQEFFDRLNKSLQCMSDLTNATPSENYQCTILNQDTRELSLANNSIDLMVTSPPYGDSRTTAAYGEFSRVSLQWLDLGLQDNEIKSIDRNLMGGKPKKEVFELGSTTLTKQLLQVKEVDEKRAKDVYAFYQDLDVTLGKITEKMKINSYQVWIVGNRTVKKVNLLTDQILVELGEKHNLHHVSTITRNIPAKRMPKENSPSNEVGKKVTTMNNEFIVILRKEK